MKTAMRRLSEAQIRENMEVAQTQRLTEGIKLVEGLAQRKNFGKGILEAYNKDPSRVLNLAYAVKNVEEHLKDLNEAQISATLGTTPENVLRVLRLGYLNTCRQDCFWEMGLATAHDVFFYLEPKYMKTLRGANKGDIMYESPNYRSVSDEAIFDANETVDGSTTAFTFTPDVVGAPYSPFTVRIMVDGAIVANDDGRGKITGQGVTGTIDYETGEVGNLTFDVAPESGLAVQMSIGAALEADENLEITQAVELTLRAVPFTLREYPITASFSKKLELTLGTSYKVEAEEAYLRAMADELRKVLDFQAFHLGYRQAKANSGSNPVTFNMQGAVGEAETDRIQSITRYIDKVGMKIYETLQRGGVSKIYGGPTATGVLTGHNRWTDTGAQNANGIYKLGMLGDIDVFRTPVSVVPDDELACIYKNDALPEDCYLVIGTLLPIHVTDKLEFSNRQTSFGVASYGDIKISNKSYSGILKILNA